MVSGLGAGQSRASPDSGSGGAEPILSGDSSKELRPLVTLPHAQSQRQAGGAWVSARLCLSGKGAWPALPTAGSTWVIRPEGHLGPVPPTGPQGYPLSLPFSELSRACVEAAAIGSPLGPCLYNFPGVWLPLLIQLLTAQPGGPSPLHRVPISLQWPQ